MENTLIKTPTWGSNQHVTKFDEAKKKRKFRIRLGWKVKVSLVLVVALSLYLNYYLLKTNYVLTCQIKVGDIVESTAGHLMNKSKCDSLNTNWIDAVNYQAEQNSKLMQ